MLQVPIVIPVVMLCIAVYLVVAPIVESPKIEFLYAFLFVLSGLLFYFPFVFFGLQLPGFGQSQPIESRLSLLSHVSAYSHALVLACIHVLH